MANNRGIVSGWDSDAGRTKGVTSPAMLRTSIASIARAEGIMLERSAATITREATKMAITLSPFTAVIQSPLGGWLCPRIDRTTVSLDRGHSTYSRVDVVWVCQWDHQVNADHPDSEVEVGVQKGTPSASPQTPAVPSGALAVLTVTVPRNAQLGTDIPEANISRCRWTAPVDGTPVGVVSQFAGSVPPLGWLLCQGQGLRRDEYPELFAAIGTLYGAPSSTTFSLPDMRGRMPVGVKTGQPGLGDLGAVGGEKEHTLTTNELPSHIHDFNGHTFSWGASGNVSIIGATAIAGASTGNGMYTFQDISGWTNTKAAGGGAAHNNMPPYLALNYIIRAV